MDAVTLFVAVGAIGLVLALSSLLLGGVLDGLFESVDLGSGLFTAPVIGGFLAAFGLGAALTVTALGTLGAVAVGVGGGVVVGGAAALLTRSLMRMRTDRTPQTRDLVGRSGTVLLPVRPDSYGRVAVAAHGQRLQLSATADTEIAAGDRIVVVEVTSPTSVVVTPLELDALPT